MSKSKTETQRKQNSTNFWLLNDNNICRTYYGKQEMLCIACTLSCSTTCVKIYIHKSIHIILNLTTLLTYAKLGNLKLQKAYIVMCLSIFVLVMLVL